ncbi:MAG: hypothetical protein IT497_07055 [Ottowia sp.]|nr:hypothetical protein [Ottowia sp.]
MKVLFAGQVPKDPIYPEANEDALEIAVKQDRLAISDGASESFDSQTWAALLVNKFVREPGLNQEWLDQIITDYLAQYETANLSWSKQAAFERGSFATLLGVESFPGLSTVDVLSIGDSLVVLMEDGSCTAAYPYSHFEDFQKRPELFCTASAHNTFFQAKDFFSKHHKTWRLKSTRAPLLLCMTDALGEWALRNAHDGTPKWETLSSISKLSQLESLVLSEREAKSMRTDDVTLIAIDPFGTSDDELSHT